MLGASRSGSEGECSGFGDRQGRVDSVGFAFLKILVRHRHGVRDVSEADHVAVARSGICV